MNIQVITVGSLKEDFFRSACGEYLKRLSRFGKIQIDEVSECKGTNGKQDIEKEGQLILKRIPQRNYIVALCVEGKQMDSPAFADMMRVAALNGIGAFTFIIGGSDGLSTEVKTAAALRLSFSRMTLPHQLMRVVLLEQIYRGFKINHGENYHK